MPLCGHHKAHKHGKTEKGHQRYKCTHCGKTFPEHFEILYYNRHLSPAEVHTIEGKTDTKNWNTDGWGGYQRVLPFEINHHVGKEGTQRLERTNGILRQQTGRWHRQQNKFAKVWEQTKVTARLVVSYFNWM
jgi:hypothetical protein